MSDGTFAVHDDTAHRLNTLADVSSLPVYELPTEAPQLTFTTHATSVFDNTGDITTVTLADGSELLVGHDYEANKISVVPANDLDSGSLYTTSFPSSFSLSNDVLGAAWTYAGDAYFSRNDGGGVFVVQSESIDTPNQSLSLSATLVTATTATNQNDGFGCPEQVDVPETETAVLTYDTQDGTGTPGDQSGDAESDVIISSIVPTRDGYTFTGWNTEADGSGTGYSAGDLYTLPSSGSATVYAQWQINTVTLAYDPQGGTGQPDAHAGDAGSAVTVSSIVPTRAGYTFAGWNTQIDGSGSPCIAGDEYTLPMEGSATLFAQWQVTPTTTTTTTSTVASTTTTTTTTTTTVVPTTTTTVASPPGVVLAPPVASLPAAPTPGTPTFTG